MTMEPRIISFQPKMQQSMLTATSDPSAEGKVLFELNYLVRNSFELAQTDKSVKRFKI